MLILSINKIQSPINLINHKSNLNFQHYVELGELINSSLSLTLRFHYLIMLTETLDSAHFILLQNLNSQQHN